MDLPLALDAALFGPHSEEKKKRRKRKEMSEENTNP
jgi:hypothetical protein